MFGYRVDFCRSKQLQPPPKPDCSQRHKPIHKFALEVCADLTRQYAPLEKYFTDQKIIKPILQSDLESDALSKQEQTDRQRAVKILTQNKGDKLYKRKTAKLYWKTSSRKSSVNEANRSALSQQ